MNILLVSCPHTEAEETKGNSENSFMMPQFDQPNALEDPGPKHNYHGL